MVIVFYKNARSVLYESFDIEALVRILHSITSEHHIYFIREQLQY